MIRMRLFFVLIFGLSIAGCVTLPEELKDTNLIVFPKVSSEVEKLLIYPNDGKDTLGQWGKPLNPHTELILDNAVRYYQNEDFNNAANLYAYIIQDLSENKIEISQEQLWIIITQRAYSLVDGGKTEGLKQIWDFQVSMWNKDADWEKELPDGLQIIKENSTKKINYYFGTSLAERALANTIISDYESAFEDITQSLEYFGKNGTPEKATWYFLIYLNNVVSFERFDWGLKANSIIFDFFQKYPNAYTIENIFSLNRLLASCRINTGDILGAYKDLQTNILLAESMGYSDPLIEIDRAMIKTSAGMFSAKIKTGNYSLEEAVLADDLEAVRVLINKGVDLNEKFDGQTALMILVRSTENLEIAKTILDSGADPNVLGQSNITALANAAGYTDNLSLVRLLLEYGADPNITSPQGWTSLMMAVRRGSCPEIVEALLLAGADTKLKTKDGNTALKIAISGVNKNEEIIQLLETVHE